MAPDLPEVLAEAQRHGWIGPDLEANLRHSGAFAELLGEGPGVVFDLGSGGGLPGLPAALALPHWRWVLVEAQQRRADFLRSATRRLGLDDRVDVRHARAEDLGRDPALRATADAVTARSFGSPAVVAECAAGLLRVGGRLVVSEPPGATGRWPPGPLAELGLGPAEHRTRAGGGFVVVVQVAPAPARYPRRAGRPERQPLF